jgi:hypothetical protein
MTIKTKTKQKKRVKQKATPFADAGSIAGGALGKAFNMPYLKGVGKWLGSGIGQIFGSGDYQMVGGAPSYNVLTNDRQIPKFSAGERTNIVCHREFLGDINGTTQFTNRPFALNPWDANTFPWLSTVAKNYQQYRIHGMIFEFRPLITDFVTSGAPGVVVFATNYNSADPVFRSKVEMENSEYAVSVKPTQNLIHAIECSAAETSITKLYVRNSAVPSGQDPRLYDLGLTQLASQGNPVQLIGELWVSYCVEFFKPVLPEDQGHDARTQTITRSLVANAFPLGANTTSSYGDIPGITLGTDTLFFGTDVPAGVYCVSMIWSGDVAVAVNMPVLTVPIGGYCSPVQYIFDRSASEFATENGNVVRRAFFTFYVRYTPHDHLPGNVNFSNTGNVLPSTNLVLSITVTKVDDIYE